ncbi:CAMK family protein kinase [Tritrichomonas foetus]|uniref:CAMK family protein kinase n=1 Tax=Tritrichomonas foetus TaxID=1144522 RepID=A0A1J4J6W9_9EUKA|nr:CAMK family protein kinase [Tritrichomonas foetus]|eukprot:OHS94393.1 CAMK family protein kinase [Tritrichomonas foetus]
MFPVPAIIGDYEATEVIGEGGFAVVYKVLHIPTSEIFALKVIPKDLIKERADKDRLQREIDTMAALQHENTIMLHDFFMNDKYYYLVTDYCKGGDLFEYIYTNPRLKEVQAATVFHQLVSAIAFCHSQGIVHRDLKPQNILITTFPFIKVCDFGLCQFFNQKSNKMKTLCGSPFYAAPECLQGKFYDGQLSDVWSLGVILYELVTKHHPWPVDNIPQMMKCIQAVKYTVPNDISPPCVDLLHALLRANPNDRMKPNDILKHPWMKLATNRFRKSTTLPRLPAEVLNQLAMNANREASGEVVSPFSNKKLQSTLNSRIPVNNPQQKTNQFEKYLKMTKTPRSSIDCSRPSPRIRPRATKLKPLD